MRPDTFDFLANVIKQRSGLALTADKAYLLESRLLPLVRKRLMTSLDDLVTSLRAKPDDAALSDITEAMTTNESYFFRDQRPFDQFRQVLLPQLLKTRAATKTIRIWSAASSSGQEAYSLAMICAEEAVKLQGWKVSITGTDLSREMVARSREGAYNQFEMQRGLPVTYMVKYFDKTGDKWVIKKPLRDMVDFREGNLLQNFGVQGTFDIIYCRNVLIYFDPPTKTRVFDTLASFLNRDGALILGGAETVVGLTNRFKPMTNERGLYVLTESTAVDGMVRASA